MRVIYEGIFFDRDDLYDLVDPIRRDMLLNEIEYPHVTVRFRPNIIHYNLLGEQVTFAVIGYGNDGENEGVLVRPVDLENNELDELLSGISNMHITLGVADGAKPVNTQRIRFDAVEPVIISGTFGFYTPDGVVLRE